MHRHTHSHTHTHQHLGRNYTRWHLCIITVICFALFFSHIHTPVYSPTQMNLCLKVHTRRQTHTHTHTHVRHMHTQGLLCTQKQHQTLTHTLKHRCFFISCRQFYVPHTHAHTYYMLLLQYVNLLLTRHLHYSEGCAPFLHRFCVSPGFVFSQCRRTFNVYYCFSLVIHLLIILWSKDSYFPKKDII